MVLKQIVDNRFVMVAVEAFAAVRGDGSVVTWGDKAWGGNSDFADVAIAWPGVGTRRAPITIRDPQARIS